MWQLIRASTLLYSNTPEGKEEGDSTPTMSNFSPRTKQHIRLAPSYPPAKLNKKGAW